MFQCGIDQAGTWATDESAESLFLFLINAAQVCVGINVYFSTVDVSLLLVTAFQEIW